MGFSLNSLFIFFITKEFLKEIYCFHLYTPSGQVLLCSGYYGWDGDSESVFNRLIIKNWRDREKWKLLYLLVDLQLDSGR